MCIRHWNRIKARTYPPLIICFLGYFSSASVFYFLEWASDSVGDTAHGDKSEYFLQLHSRFYPYLTHSQFVYQSQLDLRSSLLYCPGIVPRSYQPCLGCDPSSPCILRPHAPPFHDSLAIHVGNLHLLDEQEKMWAFSGLYAWMYAYGVYEMQRDMQHPLIQRFDGAII